MCFRTPIPGSNFLYISECSHEEVFYKSGVPIRVVPVKYLGTPWRDYNGWLLVTLIRATIQDTPAREFHGDSQLSSCGVIFKIEVTIPHFDVFEFVSNTVRRFLRKILEPRVPLGLRNALEHIVEMILIHLFFLNFHHRNFFWPVDSKRDLVNK